MPYVAKRKVRTYYKYVDGAPVDTNTPVFASQTEATNGKDGVKFLTAQNYFTITGTNTVAVNNNAVVTIDVGKKTNGIKSIAYNGVVVPNAYPSMVLNNIQCSTNNVDWVTISSRWGGRGTTVNTPLNISYPNNYRYLRFTTSNDDGRHGNGGVNNFRIKYVKIPSTPVESTENDYDYYVDEVKNYIPIYNKPYYWKVDDTPVTVFESSTPETKQFNLPTGTLKITMVGGGSSGSTHGNSASGGSGAMVQFTIDNDVERLVSLTIPSGGKVMYQGKHASGGSAGGNAVFSIANKLTVTCKGASASNSDQYIWDEGIKKTHGGVGGDGYTKNLTDSSLNFVEVAMAKGKTGGDTAVQPNVPGESVYPPYGAGGNAGNPNTTEACRGKDGYIKIERLVYYTPATPDDYDTITYERQQLVFNRKRRKYYKYVYEYRNWTRPNLTSNGTMGGGVAACQANNATSPVYYAFDSNMGNYWRSGTNPSWITFYNPLPLKVSSFQWKGFYTAVKSGTLFASDDNSNWDTIKTFTNTTMDFTLDVPDTTRAYKYFKLNVTMTGDVTHAYNIGITAKEEIKTTVEVSPTDDYDFYRDEYI